jgi:hypothetical protein
MMSVLAALIVGQMLMFSVLCGLVLMVKMMLDKMSAYHAQNQAEIRAFMHDLSHVPKVPDGR